MSDETNPSTGAEPGAEAPIQTPLTAEAVSALAGELKPEDTSRIDRIEAAVRYLADVVKEAGGHAGYSPSKKVPGAVADILAGAPPAPVAT